MGIEARYLTHHAVGGYQTYVQQLLAGFNQIQAGVEVFAILARADQQVKAIDRLGSVVVPIRAPFIGIPWREQVEIPRRGVALNLDLIHYLCNTMPLRPHQRSVVTVHDTLALRNPTRGVRLRMRLAWAYEKFGLKASLARATLIVTPSNETMRQLREAGVESERIRTIPQGVNPIFLKAVDVDSVRSFRHRHGLRRQYLLALASDDPRKNVTAVIDAFSRLRATQPNLELAILLSSGVAGKAIQQQVMNQKLVGSVIFIPSLADAEMPLLMAGAEALVFLSLEEGFGLPPLESMACGTPVICSRRPPMTELYKDTALLVDPTSSTEIVNAVNRILSDVELRNTLDQRGRRLAGDHAWERTAALTAQAYFDAMAVPEVR